MLERIEDAKTELVSSFDPDYDRIVKGMIRAYYEVMDFRPTISVEEIEDEVSE